MNISEEFMNLEKGLRSGSLCLFGFWFGRPMDNYHRSCSATVENDLLTIGFDQGEILEVWNPLKLVVDSHVLHIVGASKVKWSWFEYGKMKSPENLRSMQFIVDSIHIFDGNNQIVKGASITEPAISIY